MKRRFDVLVVGELNVDLILDGLASAPKVGKEILARSLTLTLGSSSAIFASNLRCLGPEVAFLGKVGEDLFGTFVVERLRQKRVDTSLLLTAPRLATGATVVLNHGEDRAMVTFPGVMEHLTLEDVTAEILASARHLHRCRMPRLNTWLLCAIATMAAWGLWGAWIDAPAQAGFPETLGYVVWALVMIPPCVVALWRADFRLDTDRRSLVFGGAAGFLGAGGQLVLFKVLRLAPAYLVFLFIALSPLLTIVLALVFSGERASARGWAGIVLALAAGVLLACSPGEGGGGGLLWVGPALLVFVAWGLQGFVISRGNRSMSAESLFFYMTVTGLLLVPVALAMTDFQRPICWGIEGPWSAGPIQLLNAVGALLLVYAFRHGRAMVVAPLVNAGAPVVTIALSLLRHHALPPAIHAVGMLAAVAATACMAVE